MLLQYNVVSCWMLVKLTQKKNTKLMLFGEDGSTLKCSNADILKQKLDDSNCPEKTTTSAIMVFRYNRQGRARNVHAVYANHRMYRKTFLIICHCCLCCDACHFTLSFDTRT